MNNRPDVSNRFLAAEIWIPFAVLAVGGLVSIGSLSNEIEHKADKTDVAVLSSEVENIKDTVDDIKAEQKAQREILDRIDKKIGD